MSTPYREPAEIAKEMPPMPKEKKPWPTARKAIAWATFCVLGVDAGIALAYWGQLTPQAVGPAVAVHFGIAGLIGLLCIVEGVKL